MRHRPYILTIDDDKDFNKLLQVKLADCALPLVVTDNIKDFFAHFKKSLPHLCLIDMNMGDQLELGLNIVHAIRAQYGHEIPLIVLTKVNDPKVITRAFEMGASDFVTKPLDVFFLQKKINHFLELGLDKSHYMKVPGPSSTCSIAVNLKIKTVDEFGFMLESSVYATRGTLLKLESSLFTEIGIGETLKLTVTSINMLRNGNYNMFVEFDPESSEYATKVRNWIINKRG